jgi:mannan endo-1,4-beta-mannosidase
MMSKTEKLFGKKERFMHRPSRLFKIQIALLGMIFAFVLSTAQPPVSHAQGGQFYTSGTQIFDPNGSVYVVKGVNVSGPNWTWARDSAQDADLIANSWRFNTVRVTTCIIPNETECNKFPRLNTSSLDQIISSFTSRNVVTIIAAMDRTAGYYTGADLTTLVDYYRTIATTYKNNRYVWFNVMNEPGMSTDVVGERPKWVSLHKAVIKAIREDAGNNAPIMVDAFYYGQDGGSDATSSTSSLLAGFPNDLVNSSGTRYSNLIQSVHFYQLWASDQNKMATYIDNILATNNMPFVAGEYGNQVLSANDALPTTRHLFNVIAARKSQGKVDIGRMVWAWDGGDANDLTANTSQGGGFQINSTSNPSNLTELGLLTWRDTHNNDGTGSVPPPPSAPAGALSRNGWSASASHTYSSEVPSKALDASYASRWTSGDYQASGMYFQVDMGSAQTFNKVNIDSRGSDGDYPVGYSVFVSSDGSNWGSAVFSGSGSQGVSEASFSTQTARYFKIVLTSSSSTSWWSIHEIYAIGAGGSSPTSTPNGNGSNLIVNPGFESGLSNWSDWGGNNSSAVNSTAQSGSYSLRIGTAWGGSAQNINGWSAGTTYTLSGYVKDSNGGSQCRLGIKGNGFQEEVTGTSTSFGYVSKTITLSSGTSWVQVYANHASGDNGGYCYFDALSLSAGSGSGSTPTPAPTFQPPTNTPAGSANLVGNPGFESGATNWTDWGYNNTTVVTSTYRGGTRSMQIGTGYGGSGNNISGWAANRTYTVSGYAKASNGSQVCAIGVKGDSFNESGTSGANSFTYISKTVTVPSNTTWVQVYIEHRSGSGYCYFDDITLN